MGSSRPGRRASKRLLGRALAERPRTPRTGRGEALEPGRPELAQLEHPAEQPARAVGDHDRAGRGRRLQPRGEVRGLADHRLLPRRALADQVADDHEAGRDADPRRERLARPAWRARPTASATASPARTARSASSSCARGQPK